MQESKNPLLIMGNDLKEFVKNKNKKNKVSLEFDEFYCLRCRQAVKSKKNNIDIRKTGKTIGKEMRDQECRVGMCEICELEVYRFL